MDNPLDFLEKLNATYDNFDGILKDIKNLLDTLTNNPNHSYKETLAALNDESKLNEVKDSIMSKIDKKIADGTKNKKEYLDKSVTLKTPKYRKKYADLAKREEKELEKLEELRKKIVDLKLADEFKKALNKEGLEDSIKIYGGALAAKGRQLTEFGELLTKIGAGSNSLSAVGVGVRDFGNSITKFSGKVGPAIALVQGVDTAVKFVCEQLIKFKTLDIENHIRTINAQATSMANSLNVVATTMKSVTEGSNMATQAYVESRKAIYDAEYENAMATRKLGDEMTSWILIYNQIRKYRTSQLELEMKKLQAEFEVSNRIYKIYQQFTNNFNDTFTKMDVFQRKYQKGMGIPEDNMASFRTSLYHIGIELTKFGVSAQQMLESQLSVFGTTGRKKLWGDKDATSIMATGQIIGQYVMNTALSSLEIFNKGGKDSADLMYKAFQEANKVGLSGQKVVKTIAQNLKLAEKYNFKNGVEGFIKAAKWAETARMDMNSLASAVDKVQNGGLEGILKQTAQLQVLGGNSSRNSNPFELMYEAFNDPTAYGKRIASSLSDVGRFNSSTGEMEYNGFAATTRLKAMADAYGVSVGEMRNMATAENKRGLIEERARGRFNEDQIADFTNRSEWDKERQDFVVTLNDGSKKTVGEMKASDFSQIDTRNAESYAKDTADATIRTAMAAEEINYKMALLGGFDETMKHIDETISIQQEKVGGMMERLRDGMSVVNRESERSLGLTLETAAKGDSAANVLSSMHKTLEAIAAKMGINKEKESAKNWGALAGGLIGTLVAIGAIAASGGAATPFVAAALMGVGAAGGAAIGENVGTSFVDDAVITKDGKVVKFDSNDDIVAAKTGGAIDKMFESSRIVSGGEINVSKDIIENIYRNSNTYNDNNSNNTIQRTNSELFNKPIEININGTLNLTSGNQTLDILPLIKNNDELKKELAKMVSDEMSRALNGGKSGYNGGRFYK